ELAQRVAALEAEIGVLRQEAAAARALAAGADRDVADYRAELRGHTRTLNALRETQLEHGQAITQLNGRVDQLSGRVDQLTGTVSQLTGTVGQLTGTVGQLTGRVDQLTGRVDQLTGTVSPIP